MTSPAPTEATTWWRDAVVYQIYPRSFADADGDGVGDLRGIIQRLDHVTGLGVDAVWISPFYVSPMADAGYDVADYRDVDPIFGTLGDAEELISEVHARGMRLIIDLVPNHTSDQHPWFRAALAADAGSPERSRYLFRDGRGVDGEEPPNNWTSMFGGPAWSRIVEPDGRPGQWFLHLFDSRQPDLDWAHPEVRQEFLDILRFWLDRGVDGFRVDVANMLVKQAGLPDWDPASALVKLGQEDAPPVPPMWDQDGVHDIYREWRRLLDSYEPAGSRVLVAEAWVEPPSRLARYVRPDEMHQAFNFNFLGAAWEASSLREAIDRSLAANESVGASTTWVLSNHDVVRHATRFATDHPGAYIGVGIGPRDPQPDIALGLRRARAATALMLALPGSAYLYQGEELGLPEHTTLADDCRQDPTWSRTGGTIVGRDGCRIPLPWQSGAPALGFNTTGAAWLPQPASYAALAVDQQHDDDSTLAFYRRALAARRAHGLGLGELTWSDRPEPDVLQLIRRTPSAELRVIMNLGSDAVELPAGHRLVLTSGFLSRTAREIPPDTTVWVL